MLPRGWVEAALGETTELITSGSRGWAKYYSDTGPAFIRVQNVRRQDTRLNWGDIQHVSPPRGVEGERTRLQADDIVITITADLGRIGLFREQVSAYINQHIALVRLTEPRAAPFIAAYLTSPEAQIRLGLRDRGVTRAGLGLDDIRGVRVPIPPLAEQRRIVAKLDALTARIARARAELDRVPALSGRLRHRALIACFAGLHARDVTLGSRLLKVEAGKNMRCIEHPPKTGERGVVKVSAVTWGRFDPRESKTLPADYVPPEKARIRNEDLLISRANTLELVGAVVIVGHTPGNLFLSDKILRLVVPEAEKRWIMWFLRSPQGRRQIESFATGNQLSMRNISQDGLRRIVLPLPGQTTRDKRLALLEAAFARADRIEAEAARARGLLDRLEAAILGKAFRGELVPQDPNDEPASVLLDRIRAERAAAPQPKRGRRAGQRTTAEAS